MAFENRKAPRPAAGPRIWLLIGHKTGDNRQAERIARALGEPFEVRRLQFRPRWREGKPFYVPSLFHVDRRTSDPLEPPWPDLILTIGRRPAMAALWIRRQSGGHTRIVLIGRPKRFFDAFALFVVSAQYRMPDHPRVLRIGLPLIGLDEGEIAAAADAWRARLADLPRPLTVLLVGGRTKPFRMDAAVARELLERTLASMPTGGGLFVSTSRRTPPEVVAELRARLPAGARFHAFAAGAGENPYLALLGLGDRFVVTGDSVSMLTEIARLGRPLEIYALPETGRLRRRLRGAVTESGPLAPLLAALRRWGLVGWPRDLGALHELLVDAGRAVRLGEAPRTDGAGRPEDEVRRVAERVRGLLDTDGA